MQTAAPSISTNAFNLAACWFVGLFVFLLQVYFVFHLRFLTIFALETVIKTLNAVVCTRVAGVKPLFIRLKRRKNNNNKRKKNYYVFSVDKKKTATTRQEKTRQTKYFEMKKEKNIQSKI